MIQDYAKEILKGARADKAQDIYLQYSHGKYCVYFRNFKSRELADELDEKMGQALIVHFKFLAGMNVGEKRRTQLGSCWYELGSGESQRLRLSCVGDFEGKESLVIRLLHSEKQKLEFWYDDAQELQSILRGRGLYLFSGPVGSGKTTLMYELAKRYFTKKQVMTIEDPVELVETDFIQLQVNELIGNDYDELLKMSLRHRPDLLIVGEIRDTKTAKAVLRASLTGHIVFSTIHAKSIFGVKERLLELGLSEWEIENAVQTILYQRLIAGKGAVDIAKNGFENWTAQSWNEKMAALVADGYLTDFEAQAEKINSEQTGETDSTDE
ncbi:competence type IV pilus ATPase ComGA [Lactococcus nasutitermitis]|uniref:Competence type IV pilus ATPase ComGA n=1 Tax=Lactococcus nasutitermitis TaxID=1652957 RepID=A0ABV9JEN7_9LACT|nr:competence type IV pilus ATPase ComGA [Lactococcus nasutitermitis]